MSDNTKIQWSEATWNVVTGCTRASEGCQRCYIDRTPPLRMAGRRFNGDHIGATTGVTLHSDRLGIPMRWRKPRRIFVCSLADLFHDDVPDRYIAEVFAVMSLAPQHTFQVLTKRHARLRSLLRSDRFWAAVNGARLARGHRILPGPRPVVLPNVWVGVSVENQHWADTRIPVLLDTPAAVRWVSAEPLLGPLDLTTYLDRMEHAGSENRPDVGHVSWYRPALRWVIVGGESGPRARHCDTSWVRSIVGQCREVGVPVFVKQLGLAWYQHAKRGDRKGGDIDTWPADLRVRDYPTTAGAS